MGRALILFRLKTLKGEQVIFQRTDFLSSLLVKNFLTFIRWENYCLMKNLLDFYLVSSIDGVRLSIFSVFSKK